MKIPIPESIRLKNIPASAKGLLVVDGPASNLETISDWLFQWTYANNLLQARILDF